MEGEEGGVGDLKSQRPRRRKQAGHDTRPEIWDVSACQPKRARIRASRLMRDEGEGLVGGVLPGVVETADEGRSRDKTWGVAERVKDGGV